jgi:adenylate kinase
MSKTSNKIAVIILGPQGSGKGTQADLIARKLDLFHFDTGQYLRTLLYNPAFKNDKIIQRERKLNASGVLNTPSWILKIVVDAIKKMATLGKGVVFSGSPRTFYEAFGHDERQATRNKRQKGMMDALKKYYGKENIFVFILNLALKDSLKRINSRLTCFVCNGPLLAQKTKFKSCPFCGGKIIKRKDDTEKSIRERLAEYTKRTKPVIDKIIRDGYRVFEIDATPAPYKIHEGIYKKLTK